MYILGVSCYYHDSSIALLKNGEILFAIQEERISRIRHDQNFPTNSIKLVLEKFNISLGNIDKIVFYEKPFLKFERLIQTYMNYAPYGFASFAKSIPLWLREKLFQKKVIFDELKKIDKNFNDFSKIFFSEHHLSHAASAFYPSPYSNAIILTLDGVGEWTTSSVAVGNQNKIIIEKEMKFPHSLGLLYSAFTYQCGFEVNGGEYKLMGLAPYGKPIYYDKILKNLVHVYDDGSFHLNMNFFDYCVGLKMTNSNFDELFNCPARNSDEPIEQIHMDLAASVQKVTEDIIIKICKNLKKEFNIDNLCLAGGVALNCVANGKILDEKIFKNIWIQPASGDAGGSLGAALAYWYQVLGNERFSDEIHDKMRGSLLGDEYTEENTQNLLEENNIKFTKLSYEKMIQFASDYLAKGNAIGWFQNRMEFGPRALGSRSILADPRSEDMQKRLNMKIKFRESFRPFAPVILKENVKEWFNLQQNSPYMLIVSKILQNKKINENSNKKFFGIELLNQIRSVIPSVTHVDYSSRIQTVDGLYNKELYDLLKEFEKKTKIPILVNTSFNVRDEPIVCSILDAYKCFLTTDLDILICGNFIINKDEQL